MALTSRGWFRVFWMMGYLSTRVLLMKFADALELTRALMGSMISSHACITSNDSDFSKKHTSGVLSLGHVHMGVDVLILFPNASPIPSPLQFSLFPFFL